MKKILFLFALLVCFVACNKQKSTLTTPPVFNVERTISTDKEQMYLNYGGDYRWYETLILLNDYLDEENDGSFSEVVNVFQAITDRDSTSFDTQVVKYQHFANGTSATEAIHGFWIEDFPLVDSLITINYQEAYNLIQKVNFPKPHSKHVCLRNPIGPVGVNPQWVFGNIHEQLWVDAKTGEIKTSNPAFPDKLAKPLGEWP